MRSAMALLAPAIVNQLQARIGQINPVKRVGYVSEIIVSTVRAILPDVVQGELCEIETSGGHKILGEVVAFSENIVTISCLESVAGVALGLSDCFKRRRREYLHQRYSADYGDPKAAGGFIAP